MSNEPERRKLILAVAERLLRHYGPQKTTIAEIARAAEVGVGSVYLEFPSKEAIVEELSRGRHEAVLAAMRAAAAGKGGYADRIRAVFSARMRAFVRLEDEGAHARDLVVCASPTVNPAVRSAHAQFKAAEVALVADLLKAGERAGDLALPAKTADATARALLQAYVSFSPPYVFGCGMEPLEERLEAMHALVLTGLVPRTKLRKR